MQVYANIGSPVERRTPKEKPDGKPFFTFRAAENQGRDDNRTTTWYDVTAFIDELDADLLTQGMRVKITGRVEAQAFTKRDGTTGAALKLVTGSIEVPPPRQREGQDQQQG